MDFDRLSEPTGYLMRWSSRCIQWVPTAGQNPLSDLYHVPPPLLYRLNSLLMIQVPVFLLTNISPSTSSVMTSKYLNINKFYHLWQCIKFHTSQHFFILKKICKHSKHILSKRFFHSYFSIMSYRVVMDDVILAQHTLSKFWWIY